MNIYEALIEARKTDQALKCTDWDAGDFVYHGMDNLLRWPDGREFIFDIHSLLNTKWETTNLHTYQRLSFEEIRKKMENIKNEKQIK